MASHTVAISCRKCRAALCSLPHWSHRCNWRPESLALSCFFFSCFIKASLWGYYSTPGFQVWCWGQCRCLSCSSYNVNAWSIISPVCRAPRHHTLSAFTLLKFMHFAFPSLCISKNSSNSIPALDTCWRRRSFLHQPKYTQQPHHCQWFLFPPLSFSSLSAALSYPFLPVCHRLPLPFAHFLLFLHRFSF